MLRGGLKCINKKDNGDPSPLPGSKQDLEKKISHPTLAKRESTNVSKMLQTKVIQEQLELANLGKQAKKEMKQSVVDGHDLVGI